MFVDTFSVRFSIKDTENVGRSNAKGVQVHLQHDSTADVQVIVFCVCWVDVNSFVYKFDRFRGADGL